MALVWIEVGVVLSWRMPLVRVCIEEELVVEW